MEILCSTFVVSYDFHHFHTKQDLGREVFFPRECFFRQLVAQVQSEQRCANSLLELQLVASFQSYFSCDSPISLGSVPNRLLVAIPAAPQVLYRNSDCSYCFWLKPDTRRLLNNHSTGCKQWMTEVAMM